MKNCYKHILALIAIFAYLNSTKAQIEWGNYAGSPNYISDIFRNGAVGIGWNAPYPATTAKLMVNGDVNITAGVANGHISLVGDIKGQASISNGFNILFNTSTSNGASIQAVSSGTGIRSQVFGSGQIEFWSPSAEIMRLKSNGLVAIGGSSVADPPSGYKLSVGGGIITQQVRVCGSASTWCDYVFEKGYHRNSLSYIEQFVAKNKHLPNVPSANEVEKDGLNVAEMDAVLLRQIEELWLHLIDLKKENETLKALIDEMGSSNNSSKK